MKTLLSTASVSQAESLRIALEVQGIEAVLSNENSSGVPPRAITIAVANDSDYERALGVLRSLQYSPPTPWFGNRRVMRALLVVLTAIVALVVLVCLNL